MTKPELVTLIMSMTTEYKKTHLMDKHKADLEAIYETLKTPLADETETPDIENKPAESEGEAKESVSESIPQSDSAPDPSDSAEEIPLPADESPSHLSIILSAYEDNEKIVKGRRLDKSEFKETVIEKVTEIIVSEHITESNSIRALTLSTMEELLTDLIRLLPDER